MKVVVIKAGEPVPGPAHPARWARSGLLAQALVARGHEVTWVVSTFDHVAKHQVFAADAEFDPAPGIAMVALHAPAYRGHRSPGRLWHHHILAGKLDRLLRGAPRPDAIVAALPIPELAAVAVRHARRWGVPVVVDCRDMWPDQFLEGKSGMRRALVGLLTRPMDRATREACAGATAITGHTTEFVDWGIAKAGRPRRAQDRAFPMGYPTVEPSPAARTRAQAILDGHGVRQDDQVVRFSYVGTLTRHVALDVVIDAAAAAGRGGPAIEVVLCGAGDRLADLQERARSLPNVRMLGWQDGEVVWELLRRTQCGLAPYLPSPTFAQSVPNKIIEYFSAGIPVLSSLDGVVRDLLAGEGAGWHYQATDVAQLAALMTDLARKPQSLAPAGASARQLFEARYRAEEVYGAFAAHLEAIVTASG